MKLLPVLATLVLSLSLCNMLNRNSNQSNSNTNSGNTNTTGTSGGTTTTAMSEDDKHKLFQAAGMTRDQAIILEVTRKVGLINENNMPSSNYQDFVKAHMEWAPKNAAFIREVSTPEKAKEYVEKHR